MEHRVRADSLLLRTWSAAVERAHSTASLFDDRHECRIVPWSEPRIDRCIRGTLGYEHVLPEVAERPRMPDSRLDGHEVAAIRRGQRGVSKTRHSRNANLLPVLERARTTSSPPAMAQRC